MFITKGIRRSSVAIILSITLLLFTFSFNLSASNLSRNEILTDSQEMNYHLKQIENYSGAILLAILSAFSFFLANSVESYTKKGVFQGAGATGIVLAIIVGAVTFGKEYNSGTSLTNFCTESDCIIPDEFPLMAYTLQLYSEMEGLERTELYNQYRLLNSQDNVSNYLRQAAIVQLLQNKYPEDPSSRTIEAALIEKVTKGIESGAVSRLTEAEQQEILKSMNNSPIKQFLLDYNSQKQIP